MNGQIFVISPTCVATGGTELLQQLCKVLNNNNIKASMFYTEEYNNSPVYKRFSFYNNPISKKIIDSPNNIVIVNETQTKYLKKIKKAKKYLWWLSVDNYFGSLKNKTDFLHKLYYFIKDFFYQKEFKTCKHLVQSYYAYLFLKRKKINDKNIYYLSDYLNDEYVQNAHNYELSNKQNIIVYNPKKGIDFTKLLMKEIKEYQWIPIENMTPDAVSLTLRKSKVYIDFGNHPGKDRIPREAAISGCCIITGRRGAANNDFDLNIPNKYKFIDDESEIKNIHNCINDCMNNFKMNYEKFNTYRNEILKEENKFQEDVLKIFKI